MTDTITEDRPITRRDLAERGLDAVPREKAGHIMVSKEAGGLSFSSALEVMDFAKMMAVSGNFVRKDFRNNPGMCLAVTFQAIEWRMSPFAVASKAYVVNDQVAYESQLIHAIIEARAPLQHRLHCDYEGEGPDRVCVVRGEFDNGDVREYRSPKFKDIRPKNSPLWQSDPDQQQWYYASRAWARKWTPDVLMGIYTPEEARERPVEEPEAEQAGLHARLIGSDVSREEGHRAGYAETELDQIATTEDRAGKPARSAAEGSPESAPEKSGAKAGGKRKRTGEAPKAAEEPVPETAAPETITIPTTPAEYVAFATAWMKAATDRDALMARWNSERKLRNDIGMTAEERSPLDDLYQDRKEDLT